MGKCARFKLKINTGYTLDEVSISSTTAVNYSSPTAQSSAVTPSSTGSGNSATPSQSSAELPLHAPGIILCTALLALVAFSIA
jgi:hypothetical protein